MLTRNQVVELFDYDSENGVLSWKRALRKAKADVPAGKLDSDGYLSVGIQNKYYRAHRIVWLYVYGEWPKGQIDHINRIKTDNRICNLRDVSCAENCRNRSGRGSRVSGIHWGKRLMKWKVCMAWGGEQKHLGYFEDWFDAVCARKSAEDTYVP